MSYSINPNPNPATFREKIIATCQKLRNHGLYAQFDANQQVKVFGNLTYVDAHNAKVWYAKRNGNVFTITDYRELQDAMHALNRLQSIEKPKGSPVTFNVDIKYV